MSSNNFKQFNPRQNPVIVNYVSLTRVHNFIYKCLPSIWKPISFFSSVVCAITILLDTYAIHAPTTDWSNCMWMHCSSVYYIYFQFLRLFVSPFSFSFSLVMKVIIIITHTHTICAEKIIVISDNEEIRIYYTLCVI